MRSSKTPSRPGAPRPSRRRLWVRVLTCALGATALGSALVACPGYGSLTMAWVYGCVNQDGGIDTYATGFPTCPCSCCIEDDGSYAPGCDLLDAGADASDAGDADAPIRPDCTGTCVPAKPDGWEDPQLLAIGTPLDMPSCPGVASAVIYEGYAGLDASPAPCGTCSCMPPSGACGLPATMTASTSAVCPDDVPGAALTNFDPPSDWDGGCTSEDGIPSGAPCTTMPCNRSVSVAPLTLHESGCTPAAPPATMPPAISWSTYAVACIGNASGSCAADGDFCAALEPVDGFRTCIFHDGDVACPSYSAYSDKHVFYASGDDTRSCSACICGAPAGSSCSAMISVYTDSACSSPSLLFSDSITSSASACIDVPAGSALGSKSATLPAYTPGACPPSGGEPMGSVAPVMPGTFCCLPSP